jgi:uncharacterized protein (TIGR00299 family) protein
MTLKRGRVLYLDCFSGASGDMILGGLLDAGASLSSVREALKGLGLPGWELTTREVRKGPLRALKVEVTTAEDPPHRSYPTIVKILQQADVPEPVRSKAALIFEFLAKAEARVHGIAVEDVHLHEVGAIDAIVDIVGVAAALTDLDPALVVSSPITTGRGLIGTAHGTIPVPAPAVTELLRGAPLIERGDQELVTPTGAAIIAACTHRFGALPPMKLQAVGYGAGARDTEVPNVLRVLIGEGSSEDGGEPRVLVECNLDDMSPELIPYAIERLLHAGAEDAWTSPILMKKGRPALTLSALVDAASLDVVLEVLYKETTTLGARVRGVGKYELERSWSTVQVEGYDIRVKVGYLNDAVVNIAPEHDDAVKVAQVTGVPLKEVYRRALSAYERAGDR